MLIKITSEFLKHYHELRFIYIGHFNPLQSLSCFHLTFKVLHLYLFYCAILVSNRINTSVYLSSFLFLTSCNC